MVLSAAAFSEPAAVASCTACHGEDGMGGTDPKVPVIAGVPAAHIEDAVWAYVDGARTCVHLAAMCEVVRGLSAEDVAQAADYYASLERKPSPEAYDATLASRGAELHEDRCAICHVPPDDEDVASAFGYPLHGQKSAYLEMALDGYRTGKRESLYGAMGEAIESLEPQDFEALLAYYASWRRSGEQP
jgi:sulfide dehydrogenase cytochrome subunit